MDSRPGGRPPQVRPRPASIGRAAPRQDPPGPPRPPRGSPAIGAIERRRGLPLPIEAARGRDRGPALDGHPVGGQRCGRAVGRRRGQAASAGSSAPSATPSRSPHADRGARHRDAPSIVAPDRGVHQRRRRRRDRQRAGRRRRRGRVHRPPVGHGPRTRSPSCSSRQPVGPTSRPADPRASSSRRAATTSRRRSSARAARASCRPSRPGSSTQSKPKLTIISPKASSSTTSDTVTVKGKTQAAQLGPAQERPTTARRDRRRGQGRPVRGEDRRRNRASTRSRSRPSTRPATPTRETITVRKGSGEMTGVAHRRRRTGSRAKRLPKTVTFTVTVTDPAGRRWRAPSPCSRSACPGLEAIVSDEKKTNRNGMALVHDEHPEGRDAGRGARHGPRDDRTSTALTDRQVLTVR